MRPLCGVLAGGTNTSSLDDSAPDFGGLGTQNWIDLREIWLKTKASPAPLPRQRWDRQKPELWSVLLLTTLRTYLVWKKKKGADA